MPFACPLRRRLAEAGSFGDQPFQVGSPFVEPKKAAAVAAFGKPSGPAGEATLVSLPASAPASARHQAVVLPIGVAATPRPAPLEQDYPLQPLEEAAPPIECPHPFGAADDAAASSSRAPPRPLRHAAGPVSEMWNSNGTANPVGALPFSDDYDAVAHTTQNGGQQQRRRHLLASASAKHLAHQGSSFMAEASAFYSEDTMYRAQMLTVMGEGTALGIFSIENRFRCAPRASPRA